MLLYSKQQTLFVCFIFRHYIEFLGFVYPEWDASSRPNYSAVERFDRHLKVFVPFFATIHSTVYSLLVEVLEKDSARCNFHKKISGAELPLTASCICCIGNLNSK